jgi:hypothetical protein
MGITVEIVRLMSVRLQYAMGEVAVTPSLSGCIQMRSHVRPLGDPLAKLEDPAGFKIEVPREVRVQVRGQFRARWVAGT